MDARAPQAFVGVDVAHAAKRALIEQDGFDSCALRMQFISELLFGCFERVESEGAENLSGIVLRQHQHAAEAARVGVAQLLFVVERDPRVRVRRKRRAGGANDEIAGHAKVNDKIEECGSRCAWRLRCGWLLQMHDDEFAVTVHGDDARAGENLFERGGIVDEIGFAEANGGDGASRQMNLQAANDGFHFGKFRQVSSCRKGTFQRLSSFAIAPTSYTKELEMRLAFSRRLKSPLRQLEKRTSATEAALTRSVTARLKPCPDKTKWRCMAVEFSPLRTLVIRVHSVSIGKNGEHAYRAAGAALQFDGSGNDERAGGGQFAEIGDVFHVKEARRQSGAMHFEIGGRAVIDAERVDAEAADVARDEELRGG